MSWRPVVFLDIDGVLCIDRCPPATFDPGCVAALNYLTETAGADIVVSSTWRRMRDIDERLRDGGVRGRVIGATPDLARGKVIAGGEGTLWVGATRGQEIAAWLAAHEPRRYVILDDDMDVGELWPAHVLTSWTHGLTRALAEVAVARLRGK